MLHGCGDVVFLIVTRDTAAINRSISADRILHGNANTDGRYGTIVIGGSVRVENGLAAMDDKRYRQETQIRANGRTERSRLY